MLSDQLSISTTKSRYRMILSDLYSTSIGSLSWLLSLLVASIVALIMLFCFFNVILLIITLSVIELLFLAVFAGSAFVLFGGIFMFYTNISNETLFISYIMYKTSICFSGAGHRYPWQIGVALYLEEQHDLSQCYFIGASAGSYVASIYQ